MKNLDFEEYELIKQMLLRDFWTAEDTSWISQNVLIVDKRIYHLISGKVVPEKSPREHHEDFRLVNPAAHNIRAKYEETLNLWYASNHDETHRDGLLFDKNYCINWLIKKQYALPWIDWAKERRLIDLDNLTKQIKKAEPATGARLSETHFRLIGILLEMLNDPKLIKSNYDRYKKNPQKKPFATQEFLIDYILNNYGDDMEQKGLSKSSLQKNFAAANKVRQADMNNA